MNWTEKLGKAELFQKIRVISNKRTPKKKIGEMKMKKLLTVLLALVMVLGMTACGASGGAMKYADTAATESYSMPMEAPMAAEEAEMGWDNGAYAVTTAQGQAQTAAQTNGAKKIYRATLELQTLEFEKANEGIDRLITEVGGWVEQKDVSTYSSSYRSAYYTVRVPAAKFESFCAGVGELCHVTYSTSSADDISESYYDTKARLDTAQIKLERLQALLKDADNMADIITIESAISDTEYQIDALSGTLRSYDSLVDYATVCLNLNEVYRLSNTEDAPKSFSEKLSNAFSEGIEDAGELLEDIAIWFAYNWLALIIWLVLIAVIVLIVRGAWRGVKRARANRKAKKAALPAEQSAAENNALENKMEEK